jgi:sugar phosphate isomerase/epimerase
MPGVAGLIWEGTAKVPNHGFYGFLFKELSMNGTSISKQAPSRRQFLQWTGTAAAASLIGTTTGRAAETAAAATEAKTSPKDLKLGVASYTFRKYDLDKTLALTKRAGLKYICLKSMHLPLDAKPEQIAEAVKKTEAAGITLYGCGVVYMTKESQVQEAFDYAKAAGMKVIVAAPSPAMLPLLDKKVREYDISIAIHNHGPGDKVWPTPESAYEKIKDFDPRLGLCIDIGHTVRFGVDLVQAVTKYADRLKEFHVKDVTAASAKGACIQLGRGVIDIPAFLRAVIKANYQGVLSYEYEADEADPLPGLCECVGYTKGALATM